MNDFFVHDTNRVPQGARAVADHVNDIADQIELGMDKLPSEAELKQGKLNYSTDTGIADAYIVTLTYTPTLSAGLAVSFLAGNANTGACTLNVNSTGARAILNNSGSPLAADQISPGQILELRYDGTAYRVMASDVPAAGIKSIYESNVDTNALTDALLVKLTGIETGATADQTKADIDALGIAAATLATPRNISLSGDATGTISFDGSANANIVVTVVDDLHSHIIANVDGLQTALDGKSSSAHVHALDDISNVTSATPGTDNVLTWNGVAWVDAPVSSLPAGDAATLDGIDSTQFLRSDIADTLGANLTVSAGVTVDGRDISVDGTQLDTNTTKLAGIESGATADQAGSEIKSLYEAELNTNVFTDTLLTKLNGIATSANNYSHPNHTGDVTSTGDGATVIAANAVVTTKIADNNITLAKMAQIATDSFMGRDTAGTGNVEILTATQVRTILNVADGATAYTHPSYDGDDISIDTTLMAGATIISDLDFHVTTDTLGHVTDALASFSTRNLTPGDIGAATSGHNHTGVYQPAGTYNTIIGTDSDINTSGASVLDTLTMTDGVITAHSTRVLTPSNLGLGVQDAPLNIKVIDIGDWNMDATASINVAHGITFAKIRSVSAMIRNDIADTYWDYGGELNGDLFFTVNSTNVVLSRVASGFFDGVDFDSTAYNRGWVVVQYVD